MVTECLWTLNIELWIEKPTRKSISRILFSPKRTLVIYLRFTLLQNFSCLPLGFWSGQLLFSLLKNPIYLTLHRKEFTWFHYSRTVPAFCCTGPHLATDGRYPLCCPLVSGLSYSQKSENQQAEFLVGCKDNIFEVGNMKFGVGSFFCFFWGRRLRRRPQKKRISITIPHAKHLGKALPRRAKTHL